MGKQFAKIKKFKEMVARFKVHILFFVCFLQFGCSFQPSLEGKILSKNTSNGTIYILFGKNNKYKQYFVTSEIDSSFGNYSVDDQIHLYDFTIYDPELQKIIGFRSIGSMQVYYDKQGCIYFHYDYPEYRLCPIKDLPLWLKDQLSFP